MKKLLALLKNKQIVTALITAVVATGAKLGFDVDGEYVGMIIGVGALVIGALTAKGRKKPTQLPSGEVKS